MVWGPASYPNERDTMSKLSPAAREFLSTLFECEYCSDCGGDAEHHRVLEDYPFPGTFFAACCFPRGESEDAPLHPTVAAFHEKAGRDTAGW